MGTLVELDPTGGSSQLQRWIMGNGMSCGHEGETLTVLAADRLRRPIQQHSN